MVPEGSPTPARHIGSKIYGPKAPLPSPTCTADHEPAKDTLYCLQHGTRRANYCTLQAAVACVHVTHLEQLLPHRLEQLLPHC
jgi:hypothetical protein